MGDNIRANGYKAPAVNDYTRGRADATGDVLAIIEKSKASIGQGTPLARALCTTLDTVAEAINSPSAPAAPPAWGQYTRTEAREPEGETLSVIDRLVADCRADREDDPVKRWGLFGALARSVGHLARYLLQGAPRDVVVDEARWVASLAARIIEHGLSTESRAGRLSPGILREIAREVVRARTKFPGNRNLLAALVEEVGEAFEVGLEQGPRRPPDAEALTRREAVQVACVAIRIAEEGDAAFAQLTNEERQS